MFAISGNEKPFFAIVVKTPAPAWYWSRFPPAIGVHLCF